MSANIRPAGVFDTDYKQDIALNRTRTDKFLSYGGIVLLLLLPMITLAGPFGLSIIPELWVGLIIRIAILVIAVQGLNILIGYTGQISLGHAAFMAVGAYSSAILARELGMSFWLALPFSALITGGVGLLFGLPSLRVKGFYLAMATLAAQFIIPWVLRYPMEHLTNGARPLPAPAPMIGPFTPYFDETAEGTGEQIITIEGGDRILADVINASVTGNQFTAFPELALLFIDEDGDSETIPGGDINMTLLTEVVDEEEIVTGFSFLAIKSGTYSVVTTPEEGSESAFTLQVNLQKAVSFGSDFAMYYIIVPLSVILMLAARNIIRTRVGRAFVSIRDNDLAAELLGINVFAYKLQAFFISAVYAGIAGCLIAFETNSLSLQAFQLDRSIEMLAMLVIGGAGFPLGSLFGVSFIILLSQFIIPTVAPFLNANLPNLMPFVDPINIQSAVNPVLFGLILVIFLILEPRGLAYRWEILKIAWKIRPYSQQ